ncbi:MAG TPA: aldo/keto reductase [Gammaproteobacteria bacterium]|nr:aldo/keto reductase [Gammaproteobacteria bacterium]
MKPEDRYVTSSAGVAVPRIIYGTAWKKAATEGLVARALRLGFRGVDTACQPKHYDEAGVGRGMAASYDERLQRSNLYVQTKFTPIGGHDPRRVPYDRRAPLAAQLAQSFAASLRNLATDYLDCLLLHSPLGTPEQTAEVWGAMETIYDAGGARQLGISNCYDADYLAELYGFARIKPAVVQNRFYAETGYDRPIRAFCAARGIVYQSFWTLTANPHLLGSREVAELAETHGRTPAQILFRCLSAEGIVPLTGTASEQHMREDLEIFDFDLEEGDRRRVTALLDR